MSQPSVLSERDTQIGKPEKQLGSLKFPAHWVLSIKFRWLSVDQMQTRFLFVERDLKVYRRLYGNLSSIKQLRIPEGEHWKHAKTHATKWLSDTSVSPRGSISALCEETQVSSNTQERLQLSADHRDTRFNFESPLPKFLPRLPLTLSVHLRKHENKHETLISIKLVSYKKCTFNCYVK